MAVPVQSAPAPQQRTNSCEVVSISLEALSAAQGTGDISPEIQTALDQAFGENGLGILCVTGDEEFQAHVRQLRTEFLPMALALEGIPDVAKEAIRERGTRNVNNYSANIDGNRSGLYFHPYTDDPGTCLPPGVDLEPTFYAPNLWPDEDLPELKIRARAAAPFIVGIGRLLAAALDRSCASTHEGYAPHTLSELIRQPEECNHKCRLICYHQYKTDAERKCAKGMWAAPHKDTCLLTALVPGIFLEQDGTQLQACPDPEVGLYVRDRKGAIAQIRPPVGVSECLFFQVGEALQIVSGGLYHATEHCVRGPPRANAGYCRASLAVFFQPHAHEELLLPKGVSMRQVANVSNDGLFRMFLHYLPENSTGINFLKFCHREGF